MGATPLLLLTGVIFLVGFLVGARFEELNPRVRERHLAANGATQAHWQARRKIDTDSPECTSSNTEMSLSPLILTDAGR